MEIGDRVYIHATKHSGKEATVRYRGPIPGKDGEWLGLELDLPEGNHDGILGDKRYFQGRENHCIFLQAANARPLQSKEERKEPKEEKEDRGKERKMGVSQSYAQIRKKEEDRGKEVKEAKDDKGKRKTGMEDKAKRLTTIKKKEEEKDREKDKPDHQLCEKALEEKNAELADLQARIERLEAGEVEELRQEVRRLERQGREAKAELQRLKAETNMESEKEKGELRKQLDLQRGLREAAERDRKKAEEQLQAQQEEMRLLEEGGGQALSDELVIKNEELQVVIEEQRLELERLQESLRTFESSQEEEQRRLQQVLEEGQTEDLVKAISELKASHEMARAEVAKLRQLNEMNEKEALEGRLRQDELTALRKGVAEKDRQLEEMADRVDEAVQSVELVEEMSERILKKDDQIARLKQELNNQLKEKEELDELLQEWGEVIENSDKAMQLKDAEIQAERTRLQELRQQLAIASEQNAKYKERVTVLHRQVTEQAQLQTSEGDTDQPLPSAPSYELVRQLASLKEQAVLSKVSQCGLEERLKTLGLNLFACLPASLLQEFRQDELLLVGQLRTAARVAQTLFQQILRAVVFDPFYGQEANEALGSSLLVVAREAGQFVAGCLRLIALARQASDASTIRSMLEDGALRSSLLLVTQEGQTFLARFVRSELPADAVFGGFKAALPSLENYSGHQLKSDQHLVQQLTDGVLGYGFKLADLMFLYRQAVRAAELDPSLCKLLAGLLGYSADLAQNTNVRMLQEMRWCVEGLGLLEELHPMIEERHALALDALYAKSDEEVTLYCATVTDLLKYLAIFKQDLISNQVFASEDDRAKVKLPGQHWQAKFEACKQRLQLVPRLEDQLQTTSRLVKAREDDLTIAHKRISDFDSLKASLEGRIVDLQLKVSRIGLLEEELAEKEAECGRASRHCQSLKKELEETLEKVSVLNSKLTEPKTMEAGPMAETNASTPPSVAVSDQTVSALVRQLNEAKTQSLRSSISQMLAEVGPKPTFSSRHNSMKENMRVMQEMLRLTKADPAELSELKPVERERRRLQLLGGDLALFAPVTKPAQTQLTLGRLRVIQ